MALSEAGVLGVVLSESECEVTDATGTRWMWLGEVLGGEIGTAWQSRFPRVLHYLTEAEVVRMTAILDWLWGRPPAEA